MLNIYGIPALADSQPIGDVAAWSRSLAEAIAKRDAATLDAAGQIKLGNPLDVASVTTRIKMLEDTLGPVPQRVTITESGLAALVSRVKALEDAAPLDTGWTQTLLTAATGWTLPTTGVAAWGALRARVIGKTLHINGATYKAGGANFTAGEHIATVSAPYRPSSYWQFPRGSISADGKICCQEAGSGGWVAVNLTVPIG